MEGMGVYGGKDLRKGIFVWSLEWKRVGVMDNESGDDGKEQMSLDNQVEKSEKKNDQDQVDGMRQEVYFKGKEMHNEMSGQ